jgi:hypothetical protein
VPSMEKECTLFKECCALLNESARWQRLFLSTRFTTILVQEKHAFLKWRYIYIFWMDYHFLWRNAACVWNMPCMLQVQFTAYCFLQKKFCFLTWVCAHIFFVEAVQDTYTYIIYIHLYRHISIFKIIYIYICIYGDSWYFI